MSLICNVCYRYRKDNAVRLSVHFQTLMRDNAGQDQLAEEDMPHQPSRQKSKDSGDHQRADIERIGVPAMRLDVLPPCRQDQDRQRDQGDARQDMDKAEGALIDRADEEAGDRHREHDDDPAPADDAVEGRALGPHDLKRGDNEGNKGCQKVDLYRRRHGHQCRDIGPVRVGILVEQEIVHRDRTFFAGGIAA